jgi:hypothetical protein
VAVRDKELHPLALDQLGVLEKLGDDAV